MWMSMSNSEIVQTTADRHHHVIKVLKVIAKNVLENATPFDATNDIFNCNANSGNDRVDEMVLDTQLTTTRLLLRLIGNDLIRLIALKARVLQHSCQARKGVAFLITDTLIMSFAWIGLA